MPMRRAHIGILRFVRVNTLCGVQIERCAQACHNEVDKALRIGKQLLAIRRN